MVQILKLKNKSWFYFIFFLCNFVFKNISSEANDQKWKNIHTLNHNMID